MAGGREVKNLDSKLRMVEDGRRGEGGGRRLKYGRPHQIFSFVKEKYEFVISQLCILGLSALDDHFLQDLSSYLCTQGQLL